MKGEEKGAMAERRARLRGGKGVKGIGCGGLGGQ